MRRWIGRLYLWCGGWTLIPFRPEEKKYVVIGAPHTSNWDLPVMLAIAWALDIRLHWLGKHTLFQPPFGFLLRWLGGIAIDRRSKHNVVDQVADEFRRRDEFVLTIEPEGTRSRTEYWKSGFYHIALKAGVPIMLGHMDWKTRQGGIGKVVRPTGDVERDLAEIRDFYQHITGKIPANFGPIRFKPPAESEPPAASPPATA